MADKKWLSKTFEYVYFDFCYFIFPLVFVYPCLLFWLYIFDLK